jgi:hypothetical protein
MAGLPVFFTGMICGPACRVFEGLLWLLRLLIRICRPYGCCVVYFGNVRPLTRQGHRRPDARGLSPSGLSKPSRPALSRPGGLPRTGHSALLGGLPHLKTGRPRRRLAMSAEDGPTDALHLTFSSRWLGWHAPTPRAPTSLGFAIGRRGHSEPVKDAVVFSGLVLGSRLGSGSWRASRVFSGLALGLGWCGVGAVGNGGGSGSSLSWGLGWGSSRCRCRRVRCRRWLDHRRWGRRLVLPVGGCCRRGRR